MTRVMSHDTIHHIRHHQGEERLRIPAHSGPITTLFVSPDGDYVATGGEDRRVIVWTTKKANNANAVTVSQ